jgi:hypothetical protein
VISSGGYALFEETLRGREGRRAVNGQSARLQDSPTNRRLSPSDRRHVAAIVPDPTAKKSHWCGALARASDLPPTASKAIANAVADALRRRGTRAFPMTPWPVLGRYAISGVHSERTPARNL